jgi:ribosomal protein S18 acetylase RimI-like enzyme
MLTRRVDEQRHDHARLLTRKDVALLDSVPEEMRGYGFGGGDGLLRDGFAAAVVVDEEVRAIAQTYARTGAYADIGVHTDEGYRCRGYAAACASLVIKQVQTRGETPVWSTGEDNVASMRVAEKLEFERYGERVYLIPSD